MIYAIGKVNERVRMNMDCNSPERVLAQLQEGEIAFANEGGLHGVVRQNGDDYFVEPDTPE